MRTRSRSERGGERERDREGGRERERERFKKLTIIVNKRFPYQPYTHIRIILYYIIVVVRVRVVTAT